MSDRRGAGSSDSFDQGSGPDPLVARLQALSPVTGVEVDFDAIAAEAGRRRSRRAATRVGLGVGGIASALVLLSTSGILRMGMGGSAASSAAGGAPASAASAPMAPGDATGGQKMAESRPSGSAAGWDTAYPVELCPESVPTEPGPPPDPAGVWSPPFQPSQQLVPAETPVSAVVCRYRLVVFGVNGQQTPQPESTHPLFTAQRISAGLDTLAQDLSTLRPSTAGASRACTMMAGPVDLLALRLDYAGGGVVWVQSQTDVNRCAQATNGQFSTEAYLADSIETSAQTSQWMLLPADRFGATPGSPVSPGLPVAPGSPVSPGSPSP